MKFNVIPIEVRRVPKGYQLIEAYANGNTVVIPIDHIPSSKAALHNCDLEGCGCLTHVVRFSVEDKYKKLDAPTNLSNANSNETTSIIKDDPRYPHTYAYDLIRRVAGYHEDSLQIKLSREDASRIIDNISSSTEIPKTTIITALADKFLSLTNKKE